MADDRAPPHAATPGAPLARVRGVYLAPLARSAPSVPKRPVDAAALESQGFVGDVNRYRTRKHHGTLDRAVLALDAETLASLAREGWPVAPGDLGENVLLEGLSAPLRLGECLRLGPDALLQLTEPCQPCATLAHLAYVGRPKLTAFLRTLKGRRGWYARVVRPGFVRVGDAVAVTDPAG